MVGVRRESAGLFVKVLIAMSNSKDRLAGVLEDWKRTSDPLALHPKRVLRTHELCLILNLPSAQSVHNARLNFAGFPPGKKMGRIRVWLLEDVVAYVSAIPDDLTGDEGGEA
jgi:hypothetical protein